MYKIDSFTLKQYVEDEWIKLPRFQRAKTWKAKQKFELALSIFKRYPLGCVILCSQNDKSGTSTRWLIDGRQRFTTIKDMFKSPTVIYEWATKYLGIKSSSTYNEIYDKFWKKVSEFTNYDPNDESDDVLANEDLMNMSDEFFDDSGDTDIANEASERDLKSKDSNLANLFDLIQFCHLHKKGNNLGLTQVFDISKFVNKDKKYNNKFLAEGKSDTFSCAKIKNLIMSYKQYCQTDKKDYKDKNNYIQWLDDEFTWITDSHKTKYLQEKLYDWENIQLKAIRFFEIIDSVLNNTFLAVISVENASSTDEQKIFNLINSNGTPLTAAEVLSAKPAWNKPVSMLPEEIKNAIIKLYKDRLENDDIDSSKCVRWDLPACLPLLLKNFDVFFPLNEYGKDNAGKATTLGFKIYSGIVLGGIKKDDLDTLSNSPKVNAEDFEEFVITFNNMLATIAEMPYFSTLKSWKLSLSRTIGDAPTLCFLFLAYHMYLTEDKPHSGTVSFDIFKKNCFIILDTLIYEYVNSMWRGSSDTLVSQRISSFKGSYIKGMLLKPTSEESWNKLLTEIMDDNKINGKNIQFSNIKPIIMHYYGIKNKKCSVDYYFVPDFDHIIPQALFKSSALADKDLKRDNLYNVALLPKSKNSAKNDKPLKAITDSTIINAVVEYEEINECDFDKYSKVTDIDALKDYRGSLINIAYSVTRNKLLEE